MKEEIIIYFEKFQLPKTFGVGDKFIFFWKKRKTATSFEFLILPNIIGLCYFSKKKFHFFSFPE